MAAPILHPVQILVVAQPPLGFLDRFAADAREDKLVPDLVGGCEFFGVFTSLIARTNAHASAGSNANAWS